MNFLQSAFSRFGGSGWQQQLRQLPSSRWAAVTLIVISILLAVVVAREFRGNGPALPQASQPARSPVLPSVPVEQVASLLDQKNLVGIVPPPDAPSAFHTTHFKPPPVVTPPAPKPPTTRKLEMVYQGFYQTSAGERKAVVRIGDHPIFAGAGMSLTGGLAVASVSHRSLTLTNAAGEQAVLEFNARKAVEIPIQP